MPGMLTYLSCPLSKPVSPMYVGTAKVRYLELGCKAKGHFIFSPITAGFLPEAAGKFCTNASRQLLNTSSDIKPFSIDELLLKDPQSQIQSFRQPKHQPQPQKEACQSLDLLLRQSQLVQMTFFLQ